MLEVQPKVYANTRLAEGNSMSAGQIMASWFPPGSEQAMSLTAEQEKPPHVPNKTDILALLD